MSDKELLLAAAKAAGGRACFDISPDEYPWLQQVTNGVPQPYPVRWNPLTDDGDALRLAVKLQIDLLYDGFMVYAEWEKPNSVDRRQVYEVLEDDSNEATRRAIVRAAAAMGGSDE